MILCISGTAFELVQKVSIFKVNDNSVDVQVSMLIKN